MILYLSDHWRPTPTTLLQRYAQTVGMIHTKRSYFGCMYIFMYMCVCVCMCVYECVCVCAYTYVCVYGRVCVRTCVCGTYVLMYVCMWGAYIRMYVWYVRTYVCCMWRSKCKVRKYQHWWIGAMEFSSHRFYCTIYVRISVICALHIPTSQGLVIY